MDSRSISFGIPLGPKSGAALRDRLYLIKKLNLDPEQVLVSALKQNPKKLQTGIKYTVEKFAAMNDIQIDEFDRTELLAVFWLRRADKLPLELLKKLDPSPWYHKAVFGKEYDVSLPIMAKASGEKIAAFALPRVRARLAIQEIVAAITKDESTILHLLNCSPRYLQCPFVQHLVRKAAFNIRHGNREEKRNSEAFMNRFNKALIGNLKRKPRLYPYWSIDYYFSEVRACIEKYRKLPNKSAAIDYLNTVRAYWGIPDDYVRLIQANPRAASELTLGIMVARKMIPDARTFRNVIQPHIKKLKEKYPHIRGCDPFVERILDLPTRFPEYLEKYDIWEDVEAFDIGSLSTNTPHPQLHAVSKPVFVHTESPSIQ